MRYHRESGFLALFIPTFFLFIIGVLALVFSILTLKINRNESRIRTLRKLDDNDITD